MDEHIYAAPESEVIETGKDNNQQIATRKSRFWAAMIDSLIIMLVTIPVGYFTGLWDGISAGVQPSIIHALLIGILGIILFFLLNTRSLIASGQTIGKKKLGIKIVDIDGNVPTFKQHLYKRYALSLLAGQVPVIGGGLSLINIVFIFGKQKRCLHDRLAKTNVVVA